MLEKIDLSAPQFLADRRSGYRRFRENTPIALAEINDEEVIVLSCFDDAEALFRSPKAVVNPAPNEIPQHLGNGIASLYYRLNIASSDAQAHIKLRKILNPLFSPKAIADMMQWVDGIVAGHLDAIANLSEVELVSQLSLPIPISVTCALLSMPVEDAGHLLAHIERMTAVMSQAELSPEGLAHSDAATEIYFDYFRRHQARLSGAPVSSITGCLMAAQREGTLSENDVICAHIAIFIAAIHTTMTSITNAVTLFALHTDQRATLGRDPTLMDRAWEEVLRYDSPVHFRHRYVNSPIEIRGQLIEPRKKVMVALASCNQDESRFRDGETFDILREPIRHMAFGGGGHFCLGANLGKMEGKSFLRQFLARYPSYRLSDKPVIRNDDLTFPHVGRMFVELGNPA